MAVETHGRRDYAHFLQADVIIDHLDQIIRENPIPTLEERARAAEDGVYFIDLPAFGQD